MNLSEQVLASKSVSFNTRVEQYQNGLITIKELRDYANVNIKIIDREKELARDIEELEELKEQM